MTQLPFNNIFNGTRRNYSNTKMPLTFKTKRKPLAITPSFNTPQNTRTPPPTMKMEMPKLKEGITEEDFRKHLKTKVDGISRTGRQRWSSFFSRTKKKGGCGCGR